MQRTAPCIVHSYDVPDNFTSQSPFLLQGSKAKPVNKWGSGRSQCTSVARLVTHTIRCACHYTMT